MQRLRFSCQSPFKLRRTASDWLFFGKPLVLEYRSGLFDKMNKDKNRQSAVEIPKNTGLLFLAGRRESGGPERCNCRRQSSVAQIDAALQTAVFTLTKRVMEI